MAEQRASSETAAAAWPALDWASWRDTALTVQLWTQVVGKVRLALTPWLNHGWHVPLYVDSRGLTTSLIHAGPTALEIAFDFVAHRLRVRSAAADAAGFALEPMAVADFHRRLLDALRSIGVEPRIHPMPNEVEAPIAFDRDFTHRSYDGARRWPRSGARCSRRIASFASSARRSSASRARCTSSGAASIWR